MDNDHTTPCPGAGSAPGASGCPFSPLGWSVWRRLAVALAACLLLWAAVLWALD
jgi:hypothetical protein